MILGSAGRASWTRWYQGSDPQQEDAAALFSDWALTGYEIRDAMQDLDQELALYPQESLFEESKTGK
jgi:hypothetical protein